MSRTKRAISFLTGAVILFLLLAGCPRQDFRLSANPEPITLGRGDSTTVTVEIERANNLSAPIQLSLEGAPAGVTGTFSPNPAPGNSATLTLTAEPNVQLGQSDLTIRGSSGGIERSITLTLTVEEEAEIIIPPTTKVMDESTRANLTAYEPDGTLRSSTSTGVLAALEPGDVLVSEPTTVAPYGLLRKVATVRQEGAGVVVETEEASLQEAIHQGELSFTVELEPEDIETAIALQEGITTQGFNLNLDTDFGTGGRIRAVGSLAVEPILEVNLGLSCDRKFLGVCIEIPDLNFRTRLGVQENANLRLSGNASYSWGPNRRFELASYAFSPLTFFIGPVPVVFTPRLTLYLGTDGAVTASFNFQAQQNLTLAVGFEYHSDTGFRDLSERTTSFSHTSPTFEGNANARAYAGVSFELLLYGLVGPFGAMEAGPQLSASISGVPTSPSLLWRLEGCMWLKVGVRSNRVLGINYEKDLYRACSSIAQQENRPPSVSIQSPNAGSQIYQGVSTTLRGTVFDPDGHGATCRWTSSRAADPLPVNSCEATITFLTTGTRTLTLTGTDPLGRSASASVSVNVQEPPDIVVTITNPPEGAMVGPDEVLNLTASASGGTAPYDYEWTVAFPTSLAGSGGTLYTVGSGATLSWTPSATLPITFCEIDSYARLNLEATDANGLQGSRSIVIRITRIC